MKKFYIVFFCFIIICRVYAQREIISLDGRWNIQDSVDSLVIPKIFEHTVDVPGLVRTSVPGFKNVDKFISYDYDHYEGNPDSGKYKIDNPKQIGISLQKRNYFWYERKFTLGNPKEVVILKVNKAQFGSAIWINNKYVGQNLSDCTAGYYNITKYIRFNDENEIMIRIGAHPGVLPYWMYSGRDDDKRYWTPGIWDDVSLILCNNPYISSVQVAPDINKSIITVQAVLNNLSGTKDFDLKYFVREWKSGKRVTEKEKKGIILSENGNIVITKKIIIPKEHLWSPGDPFLYTVELETPPIKSGSYKLTAAAKRNDTGEITISTRLFKID
jgi:beta-galactosidase